MFSSACGSGSSAVQSAKAQINYSSLEEKRVVESQKSNTLEDKLAALRAYRRAKGLCYKYGVK